jgi:hypothetical protein
MYVMYTRDTTTLIGQPSTGPQKCLATSLYIRLPQALLNLFLTFGLTFND